MRIAVVGLWHLGTVTAAGLAAEGHDITAFDELAVIERIESGVLPVDEPGLAELIVRQRADDKLRFDTNPERARDAELVWITYDTPIDDHDRPDVQSVIDRTTAFLAELPNGSIVAVSSQLPVGSISKLERLTGHRFEFVCIPENLRLGSAIAYFRSPDRFVVGTRTERSRAVVTRALEHFAPAIVWTSVESAEMVKHAINAFLATSVVFANELAAICERVGADAREVERGLKSDVRIGPKAYVRAGEAFAGGTLARDIAFLAEIAAREQVSLDQISGTATSNDRHRDWVFDRVRECAGEQTGIRVALLGLVYKPGTNTLRASNAVNLARRLAASGATVTAFDPAIEPGDERVDAAIEVMPSARAALAQADIAVISTPWPEFRDIDASAFHRLGARAVIDESRFLEAQLDGIAGLRYVAFGRARSESVGARA